MIGVMRESLNTQAEKLEDYRIRFADPDDLTKCEPCAKAVVDRPQNEKHDATQQIEARARQNDKIHEEHSALVDERGW